MHQLLHPGTLLTMAQTIWSSALLIVLAGCVRVLVSATLHMPFDVGTMMLVAPGRLLLCHSCFTQRFLSDSPVVAIGTENVIIRLPSQFR